MRCRLPPDPLLQMHQDSGLGPSCPPHPHRGRSWSSFASLWGPRAGPVFGPFLPQRPLPLLLTWEPPSSPLPGAGPPLGLPLKDSRSGGPLGLPRVGWFGRWLLPPPPTPKKGKTCPRESGGIIPGTPAAALPGGCQFWPLAVGLPCPLLPPLHSSPSPTSDCSWPLPSPPNPHGAFALWVTQCHLPDLNPEPAGAFWARAGLGGAAGVGSHHLWPGLASAGTSCASIALLLRFGLPEYHLQGRGGCAGWPLPLCGFLRVQGKFWTFKTWTDTSTPG